MTGFHFVKYSTKKRTAGSTYLINLINLRFIEFSFILGSSKAMEQYMVVEMVKKVNQSGARVSTIIGDDDAATMSRLRHDVELNSIEVEIKKQSDRSHMKNNFANQLYALQMVHNSLSSKVIRYIQKCWNYMIVQNVENENGISTGRDAMYKHPFRDHSSCGDWCSYRENPDMNYKSIPLPRDVISVVQQVWGIGWRREWHKRLMDTLM